ncbi:MAG TPA: PAS domain-containing protein [Fervidobacterium sp.]|nr:PAS domain-containing protein [Fervidobacterium sp.]HPC24450.1 PAS domain-containing protein [Fervidobacterium sp.]HQI09330.1 PAS domain-containing protein [Fervidobacterium sp.]HQO04495.1 PAS domain-containing protein [Fervidobacterium sp.]HQQ18132.1 PAS domain-containing protein [Fervidobacterium sp.]
MRYLYFLQQFFDRLPAPAFIKDNKGRYIWVNKELENAVGLTEERIIGKFEAVILNDESIEDLDRKVMRTRKNQVHQEMINGRYYTIHRMPIRLGTGSYGVAGIMYDMTEKVLEQTIYQMQSFVEKLIIELLSEQDVDTVEFMKNIVKKFNEQYPKITVTLLKDNSYVAGREDRKLSERAATIDEIKTMIHDRRTYQVVPVENYKFIIYVPEEYTSISKALSTYLSSQVLAAIKIIENRRAYKEFGNKLETIIKMVQLWESSSSLDSYLQSVLDELVKIIPETQKASIWLLDGDDYRNVAVYNYGDEVKNVIIKTSEDNYGKSIGENKVAELTEVYKLNKESPHKDIWELAGVTDPNFSPLVGSVKIGDKKLVIISLDNFEGKHFSEESKKILNLLVDLLSTFLTNKTGKKQANNGK